MKFEYKSRWHHSVSFSIATLIGKFCSLEKRKDKKDRKVENEGLRHVHRFVSVKDKKHKLQVVLRQSV